jgi:hypothetical protein
MRRAIATAAWRAAGLLAWAGAVSACSSSTGGGNGSADDGGTNSGSSSSGSSSGAAASTGSSSGGGSGSGSGSGGSGSSSDASGSSSGDSGSTADNPPPPACAAHTVSMTGYNGSQSINGSPVSGVQNQINANEVIVSGNASNGQGVQIAVAPSTLAPIASGQSFDAPANEVAIDVTDTNATSHQCILASGQGNVISVDDSAGQANVSFAGKCGSGGTIPQGTFVSGCMNTTSTSPDGGM